MTFVAVSRAPLAEIEAFKRRMGWRFPGCRRSAATSTSTTTCRSSDDEVGNDVDYNYERQEIDSDEMPGASVFYKDATGAVFHTYSAYARGLDILLGAYNFLDLTPKGRDEDELPWTMAWVRHHDEYDEAPTAVAIAAVQRGPSSSTQPSARSSHADRRAEDHPLPLVRHRGRGRGEILLLRSSRIRRSATSAATSMRARRSTASRRDRSWSVEFELEGQKFAALNGGPQFKFDEAISFQIALPEPEGGRLFLEQAYAKAARKVPAAG